MLEGLNLVARQSSRARLIFATVAQKVQFTGFCVIL